jgi:hypothetical protein
MQELLSRINSKWWAIEDEYEVLLGYLVHTAGAPFTYKWWAIEDEYEVLLGYLLHITSVGTAEGKITSNLNGWFQQELHYSELV